MVAHSSVDDSSGRAARRELVSPRHAAARPETHYRSFRNEKEFRIISETTSMLETSGFYWGPMSVEEAHRRLKKEPLGTFLIRDSQQKDVFFTLSYRAPNGPASIRITFQCLRFSLTGSKESFESLFELLEHYTSSAKKSLGTPYRRVRVQSLQELCRKQIMVTCGGEQAIDRIPVHPSMKSFLRSFPYRL